MQAIVLKAFVIVISDLRDTIAKFHVNHLFACLFSLWTALELRLWEHFDHMREIVYKTQSFFNWGEGGISDF